MSRGTARPVRSGAPPGARRQRSVAGLALLLTLAACGGTSTTSPLAQEPLTGGVVDSAATGPSAGPPVAAPAGDAPSGDPAPAAGLQGSPLPQQTALAAASSVHGLGPLARARRPGPRAASAPSAAAATGPVGDAKILVVVMENHSTRQVAAGMPYLASLGRDYGSTTAYQAVAHPSLPNYLAMAGGSTYGVTDDAGPSAHPLRGPSVFDLALSHGRTAKTYAEAMPGACGQRATSRYAVKHNPWTYFSDATSRANCRRFDVPSGTPAAGALREDVAAGRLPNVGMLVPDICNDGHDCSLAVADNWLKGWMTPILAGPDFRAGRLTVVVAFDEDDRRDGNRVLTTVVSPRVRGRSVGTALTHYSLTRALAEVAGAPAPGRAASATSLRTAFGL